MESLLQPVLADVGLQVGRRLTDVSCLLRLLTGMAQEEMEVDLQPVADYPAESHRMLPPEPSGHATVLSSEGGSVTVISDDEAVGTSSAGTGQAAAGPDHPAHPSGLQRFPGVFDQLLLVPGPQAATQPRVRRARRQQRIGGSQRTVSAR